MGRHKGYRHSAESRAKMSASMKLAHAEGRLGHLVDANVKWRHSSENAKRLRAQAVRAGKACGRTRVVSDEHFMLMQHYNNYRGTARRRGLVFDLEFDQFSLIVMKDCWYCGGGPQPTWRRARHRQACMNGIDRLDNAKGYIQKNIVPCCGPCNRAKHVMSVEDFLQMARRISERHQ